jgi:hypothetical protein
MIMTWSLEFPLLKLVTVIYELVLYFIYDLLYTIQDGGKCVLS